MQISLVSLRIAVVAVALTASAGCAAEDADVSAQSLGPRWEVTVGASGKHNGKGWKIALPETEIEYRWRERLVLVAKNSWAIVKPENGPSLSGLGTAKLGLKWRFWDAPEHDFSMALYPQLARSISRSSVRLGVISAEKEFALATETIFAAAGVEFEVKAGRKFINRKAAEWMLEVKAARNCRPSAECNLTVEHNFAPTEGQRTLVKAGIDWKINAILTLKPALGREVGPRGEDRKNLTASLGLKFKF